MKLERKSGTHPFLLLSRYRTQLMGVAILWVIFFHSSIWIPAKALTPLRWAKDIGYGGVDIFMLLSGMGLCFSWRSHPQIRTFYQRRFLRILPSYLPIVAVFAIAKFLAHKTTLYGVVMNLTTLSYWFNAPGRFDWYIPALLVFYLAAPFLIRQFNGESGTGFRERLAVLVALALGAVVIASPAGYLLMAVSRIPIFIVGIILGSRLAGGRPGSSSASVPLLSCFFVGGVAAIWVSWHYFSALLWRAGLFWYPFLLLTMPLCVLCSLGFRAVSPNGTYRFPILTFFGSHSLELYMFNMLFMNTPMSVVRRLDFDPYHIVYNLLNLAATLLLAVIWRKLVGTVVTRVQRLWLAKQGL